MRDQLTKDSIDTDAFLSGMDEDELEEFTIKNHQLDARRRLEDALEERRLSRELREFDFDFDDFEEFDD